MDRQKAVEVLVSIAKNAVYDYNDYPSYAEAIDALRVLGATPDELESAGSETL